MTSGKIKILYGKKPGQKIRPSKRFIELVNYVKARSLLEGKKMPSSNTITEKIAEIVTKEELWNEFI